MILIVYSQRRKEERDRDNRYTSVMRSLVWRYVSAMHRKFEESPVTEDDINEVKGEISAMRYELIEIFEKNGMDISSVDRKEKSKYLYYLFILRLLYRFPSLLSYLQKNRVVDYTLTICIYYFQPCLLNV